MATELKVEFESDIQERIQLAFAVLTEKRFRKLMGKIGQIARSETQKRFSTKVAPDGSPWAPTNRPNGILLDTGALRGSIKFKITGNDEVIIGSEVNDLRTRFNYAKVHQETGDRRGIKRKFLGISRNDEKLILEAMDSFLEQELNK